VSQSTPSAETTVENLPIYWFARLERAVEEGNHQTAAEAQRELARLGVEVRYGRPRRNAGRRQEVVHAAD
jgi:hypothetical protein